jgi:hypothetical protein
MGLGGPAAASDVRDRNGEARANATAGAQNERIQLLVGYFMG